MTTTRTRSTRDQADLNTKLDRVLQGEFFKMAQRHDENARFLYIGECPTDYCAESIARTSVGDSPNSVQVFARVNGEYVYSFNLWKGRVYFRTQLLP